VVGGYFDPMFSEDTKFLFDKVFAKEIIIVVSKVLTGEIDLAPQNVKDFFNSLPME
jgi:hypothetical protein